MSQVSSTSSSQNNYDGHNNDNILISGPNSVLNNMESSTLTNNSANLQSSAQNNSNEQGNKRKNKSYKRKLPSFVWEYFDEIIPNQTKCKKCDFSCEYYSSTSIMTNHLLKKHGISNKAKHCKIRKYNHFLYDQDESEFEDEDDSYDTKDESILNAIVDFIVGTNQPLSLVDHPDFKFLLKKLNKHFNGPCKATLRNKLIPNKVYFFRLIVIAENVILLK